MSKDIMNDTSDAFSMVAPIHQRELQLGNRKVFLELYCVACHVMGF